MFKSNLCLRLIESKDTEGKDWEVVLIQAGKSLNKKFYSSVVLKKAKHLFENAKAFAYEFKGKLWNHLPGTVRKVLPEGCVKNVVGWYDNVRFGSFKDEQNKTQEGLLAKFHISENAEKLRKFLKDAWEHGKKTLLGFSIDGEGEVSEAFIEGEKVWNVDEIKRIDEITLVTQPAAGGQFRRLLASLDFEEEEMMNWLKSLYEKIKALKEELIDGVDPENITEDQEISFLKFLAESDEFPQKEKIEEAEPFVTATMERLVSLLKGDKKTEASLDRVKREDEVNPLGSKPADKLKLSDTK